MAAADSALLVGLSASGTGHSSVPDRRFSPTPEEGGAGRSGRTDDRLSSAGHVTTADRITRTDKTPKVGTGVVGQHVTGHAGTAAAIDVEVLYRRYGDMVLGRCRTLLGNDEQAQEACQDIFLRIHRYRESFRGEARPSTFLFRVTTNHCLNLLRSRKRRPETAVDDLSYVPDTVLDVVELRQLLDKLLVGQDERTQQCVVHHFVDGMTHAQVGELLGVTDAAVRKRIARFRADVAHLAPPWLEERP